MALGHFQREKKQPQTKIPREHMRRPRSIHALSWGTHRERENHPRPALSEMGRARAAQQECPAESTRALTFSTTRAPKALGITYSCIPGTYKTQQGHTTAENKNENPPKSQVSWMVTFILQ